MSTPDLSLIRVNDVEVGTTVRVLLPTAADSERTSFMPHHMGLFRETSGGNRTTLDTRDWLKLRCLNKRSFFAQVIENDTVGKTLTLEFVDLGATKSDQLRYIIIFPYTALRGLSRLVRQGRQLDAEDEETWRRQHRRSKNGKQFFHPFDRFIGVSLVALTGEDMLISFTYQLPATANSYTIPLPSGVFENGNYTIVASYNTLVGSSAPVFTMPDVHRNSVSFKLETLTDITVGTTIDFMVKER